MRIIHKLEHHILKHDYLLTAKAIRDPPHWVSAGFSLSVILHSALLMPMSYCTDWLRYANCLVNSS